MRGGSTHPALEGILGARALHEVQHEVNQHDDDDEPHQEPYYVLHVFSSAASWLSSPYWTRAASS